MSNSLFSHVDIPADDTERARGFYAKLLGWSYFSVPGHDDYYFVQTEEGVLPSSAIGKRVEPEDRITVMVKVDSLDDALAQVAELGGQAITPKIPVSHMGWMATVLDTEGNPFGLWQDDESAP
jgi:uncharacterized protein